MRQPRLTLTALLLLALAIPVRAGADLEPARAENITGLVETFMQRSGVPSATVLVDRGGEAIYRQSFGQADIEGGIAATPETAYAIGSITKSFTALAFLQLAADGRINLEAPLRRYLPDYEGPAADVAVRHLLDHTAGIPNYTNEISTPNAELSRGAFSRDEMVALFEQLPLHFEPGEMFSYSNSGYYLLGLIIEAVSGLDYYEYLQRNVFNPLGMDRSYSGNDRENLSDFARGYSPGPSGPADAPSWSYLAPFSAGSLVSTVDNLVTYRRGVFRSPGFSDELRQLLLTTYDLNDGTPNVYALGGLILSRSLDRRKISHSGDIWGYASNHAYYPDDDTTIVILTNGDVEAPSVVSLEMKIAREVFGVPQPQIANLVLTDQQLSRLEGDYRLHPFIFGPPVYGFSASEGRLYLSFGGRSAGGPSIPLLAQGGGRFVMAFDDEWVFEFEQSEGPAPSFRALARDGYFHGRRMDP